MEFTIHVYNKIWILKVTIMPSGYLLFDNKWIHSYIAKSGFLEFSSKESLSGMMGVDFWARRDIITWVAKSVLILQIV